MDEHRPGVRLLLLAILLLLAGPAAGADRWERYAVVVGADRGAAGQDALRYAEGDA
ncbi:MAG: hypothetical protein FJ098_07025, partial [Deltaproteobacteria bacterium]|nr:hypothetical protein [Deltaproteobacteria bacterium]